MGLFFAHIPFMVNRAFSSMPAEWLQQHPLLFTMNRTNHTFFLLRFHTAWPSLPGHSTILLRSESVQSFSLWQQATIEVTRFDHSPHRLVITFNRSHVSIGKAYTPRSLYDCLFALHIYGCCSSHTLRLWWIAHSTQHQRNGCNNIPSFLQRTTPIAHFLWRFHTARRSNPGHSIILLQSSIPSGMRTKLPTVAASNNRVHPTRSLDYCLFAPHIYIVLFFAHILFVVNHTFSTTPAEWLQHKQ